jgi:hypothetical protein
MQRLLHSLTVNFIVWYLRKKCGGAVHFNPYGRHDAGYALTVNENEYHNYRALVSYRTEAEIIKMIWTLREAGYTVH